MSIIQSNLRLYCTLIDKKRERKREREALVSPQDAFVIWNFYISFLNENHLSTLQIFIKEKKCNIQRGV